MLMAMSLHTSTPSVSAGLCCGHFGLDLYLQEYKNFLCTECFAAMASNGDTEKRYKALDGLVRNAARARGVTTHDI